MLNTYDIAYALAAAVSAPVWLLKAKARRKVLRAFSEKMGRIPPRQDAGPALLIHAVSLGEINATRGLVKRLQELQPHLHIIISTTTDTGFARATELYGRPVPGSASSPLPLTVIRYPLDFSSAITRTLDALRPCAVVLMELEVWPNFMLHCSRRNIPVILANGRMTEPSFRRYRLAGPIVRRMFSRLSAACVQDDTYAQRFQSLGCSPDRLQITGSMKFDTATVADRVDGDAQLAADLGLPSSTPHSPIWVCGSTGPGEERIILEQYRLLLPEHPGLRLVIVPRHPERFDEVAQLIAAAGLPVLRRSTTRQSPPPSLDPQSSNPLPVILGDTMGELRKFYGLADIVFVGRTLVDLGPRQHGSDMIEPAALAKPVIVGPYTGNFAEAVSRFRAATSIVEVGRPEDLAPAIRTLLADTASASAMAHRAQQVVLHEKGATERNVQVILRQIGM